MAGKRKPAPPAKPARAPRPARARAAVAEAARLAAELLPNDPNLDGAPPPPPPPPARGLADGPASSPPPELTALGSPPDDPLEAQAWLHRVMILSAFDAARDTRISDRERRRELRTISSSAAKLLPHAKLWEAVKLIKADRAELDAKQRGRRGAAVVALPTKVASSPAAIAVELEAAAEPAAEPGPDDATR